METFYTKTEYLIGMPAMDRLKNASVAVIGVGGVGGTCAEALARAGVGKLLLLDFDVVSVSNINRQAVAYQSTVGRRKVDVMKERILDINPHAEVEIVADRFPCPVPLENYNYIVDAIDTITSKLLLIEEANRLGVSIISAMGAGNKLTTAFKIDDIYNTTNCPVAKVMRKELRKRNVPALTVCYSNEPPLVKHSEPSSISFAPPAMALTIAAHIIKMIIEE